MLHFPESENPKQMGVFIRELLDADLELTRDAEMDVETENIEPLFPEILWVEDREKCVKRFYEFRARLSDDFIHQTTELEWYMLMRLYYQWQQIYEDMKKSPITPEHKASIKQTLDLLDDLADNFDGSCERVASLLELYKERPLQFSYDDLDRFTDLMPRDVLQGYVQIRDQRQAQ